MDLFCQHQKPLSGQLGMRCHLPNTQVVFSTEELSFIFFGLNQTAAYQLKYTDVHFEKHLVLGYKLFLTDLFLDFVLSGCPTESGLFHINESYIFLVFHQTESPDLADLNVQEDKGHVLKFTLL
jgi:hypothetical protein